MTLPVTDLGEGTGIPVPLILNKSQKEEKPAGQAKLKVLAQGPDPPLVIIVNDNLLCFYVTLLINSESVKNAELMQRLSLVAKLLFVLHDDSVTDSTAHTIASVLSVLLSNTSERKNLLRYDTNVTTYRVSYHASYQ